MTDFKTIMYSMTPNVSGSFLYTSANNSCQSIQFNNGVNWSVQTSAVDPTDTAGVNLTNIGGINYGAVDAVWYFGKITRFDTLSLHFASNTDNTTRTVTWEYWNGSSWTALPQSGTSQTISAIQGSITFQNNQHYVFKISPLIYSSWTTTSVNGSSSLYFIRVTINSGAFSAATLQSVSSYDYTQNVGYPAYLRIFTTTDDISFTNNTLVGRSNVSSAFTFTANTTSARLYLGSSNPDDLGFVFNLTTAGSSTGNGVWEYWNGSTWATIESEPVNGNVSSSGPGWSKLLRVSGNHYIVFKNGPLSGFATTTINSVSAYWIRYRVTTTYSTSPVFALIMPLQSTSISRTVYIPETVNRTIQSAFIKMHLTNSETNSPQRFVAFGRFGSDTYRGLNIGEGYTPGLTFSDMGGKIFSTTAFDGVFTDATNELSDSGTNDQSMTNAVQANIYFCYPNETRWAKGELMLAITPHTTNAFTGGVVEWEYWNGSTWTAFEPVPFLTDKNLNGGTHTRFVMIPILPNWTTTTVNSFTGYIIRRRILSTYTVSGIPQWSAVYSSVPGFNNSTFTNTGENQTFPLYIDCTSLFRDTFTGSSQTFDVKLSYAKVSSFVGTNLEASGELYITYSADEQTTRIKTVMIPLDTIDNTSLSNSLTTVGSSELPDLATYLPESSKTIRNFYIVWQNNDQINTALTSEYRMKIGSADEKYSIGRTPGGLTSTTYKQLYVDDAIATGSAQNIQVAISSRHFNFRNWSMYAIVTYEYNASTTTRTINSLLLPFETSSTMLPQDESRFAEKIRKSFFIEEPGTINNVRIGAYVYFSDAASAPILNIKEKSQVTYKTLTFVSSLSCGGYRYGYRLPVTTLTRGLNEIGIDFYASSNSGIQSIYCLSGFFIVNYHSDVHSGGIEKHNKTISCLGNIQRVINNRNIGFNNLTNPLSNWYINSFGLIGEFFSTSTVSSIISVDNKYVFENNSIRETLGAGGFVMESGEHIHYDFISDDRGKVKKYPGDSHAHRTIDLFNGGRFLVEYGNFTIVGGFQTVAQCHEITYTITGNVIGYSGDGSGLTVSIYDNDTSDFLLETTTGISGSFTATWYDNTREIVCAVYDSVLDKSAKSAPGIAGTDTFTLDLRSSGVGVATISYAFIG